MKRSTLLVGALALLPAAGVLAVTQLADAHFPDIGATAACVDRDAKVVATVESWQTEDPTHRVNSNIAVQWDDVTVASGAFTAANNYRFTVDLRVPADGQAHVLRAIAIADFGPNAEHGSAGQARETTVRLPADCSPPATTSTTPVTAPPTTVQKVETAVLGVTVTRPADVATPVEVLPRFAG